MAKNGAVQVAMEHEAYRRRITRAAAILEIDPEKLAEFVITKVGAKHVGLLGGVTFIDLTDGLEVMPAPARLALLELKGTDADADAKYVSEKKVGRMSAKQLVANYDPREADNAVGKRLQGMSHGKRFVVFAADGTVDVESSVKLLGEIRDNFPERDIYVESGKDPRVTYRVGERPDQMADENPLYSGRVLRPDQSCDQTNRSWDGVPQAVRVLLHLAVHETREIVIHGVDAAHTVLDLAVGADAEKKVRERYARAAVRYAELAQQGKLPTLKVPRSGGATGDRPMDPFHRTSSGHKSY